MCECNIDGSEVCCEHYCCRPIRWGVVLKGEGDEKERERFLCGHCYLRFKILGLVETESDGGPLADKIAKDIDVRKLVGLSIRSL
jgi:hypothetical protein